MLRFFRKYQRFFFIVVTVVVVVSFSFFGTFSTFVDRSDVKDEVIGKALDGSDLWRREIETLTRFLSTSSLDAQSLGRGKIANLLNDDVVRKDFLQTGLGEALAGKFFEELKPELEERSSKIKNYTPYAHPGAPFVSLQEVWKQFAPPTFRLMNLLKEKSASVDATFFVLLSQMAVEHGNLPTEMVRRLLAYQQSQYSWLKPDENLYFANLNPFGFESLEDWLGVRYLQLVAQFILNAAKVAEKKGLSVSTDEARAELLQNAFKGLKKINPQTELTNQDVYGYFVHQVQALGLDESGAIKLWKKVMLFRRLAADKDVRALVDAQPFEAESRYNHTTVVVEQYELPRELILRDFRGLMKLQCYLEAAGGASRSNLQLPSSLLSVQEIEKKYPELVQRRGKLKWKMIKKDELAQRITLKETWEWQTSEKNWLFLQAQFPVLGKEKSNTAAGRMEFLERLDPKERLKVDRFARAKIVEQHPEWVEEAFARAQEQADETGLRLKGGSLPLSSMVDASLLIQKLSENSAYAFADEAAYFQVSMQEMAKENELVPLTEVLMDGTLDEMLDKQLEEAYPEVRKKNSARFQMAQGKWKPLDEVKDQVGEIVFAPLLRAIEEDCVKSGGALPQKEGVQPLEFYVSHRFYAWMREMRSKEIASGAAEAALWKLQKKERSIKRADKTGFATGELFTLADGTWSSVVCGEKSGVYFFHLLSRAKESAPSEEQKKEIEAAISTAAARKYHQQLLEEMITKKAIGIKL